MLQASHFQKKMSLASNLKGKTIGGWEVCEKISKSDGTGGAFSSGYQVRNSTGRKAFMKAINIGYTLKMFSPPANRTDVLNEITSSFNHERDLLKMCGEARLDRVVQCIATGEYDEGSPLDFVPYLIFEIAEKGDVRRHTNMKAVGLAWRLRVFHGVCVGVMQLHRSKIAHQDLKPSNVFVFGDDLSKIGDLGRSTTDTPGAPFNDLGHCGDISYAPIELHYRHHSTDWNVRRKGADLFMLGGILAFLVANVHLLDLILSRIPSAYLPNKWAGTYPDAIAVVANATNQAVDEIAAQVTPVLQADIKNLLTWLSNPDPTKRTDPQTANKPVGDVYSLERIVSIANTTATRAWILAK